MKTPMQELIDELEKTYHLTEETKLDFKKYLEKERQMVIDAFQNGHINGWVEGSHDETKQSKTGEQYFELTYNNKQDGK